MDTGISTSSRIPSVDEILKTPQAHQAVERFGRTRAVEAVRHVTAILRREIGATVSSEAEIDQEIADLFAALGT